MGKRLVNINKRSYSIALASIILFFLFSILFPTVASAAQIIKIGNGTDPAVHGNKVVWTDNGVFMFMT